MFDLNSEFSAGISVAHSKFSPHILLNNGFRHEETNPCAYLWTFGCKVRVEYLVNDLIRYTPRIVSYSYNSAVIFTPNCDYYLCISNFPFDYSVSGIVQDIEKYLRKFVLIATDDRIVMLYEINRDLRNIKITFQKGQSVFNRLNHIKFSFFLFRFKVVSEIVNCFGHMLDDIHRFGNGSIQKLFIEAGRAIECTEALRIKPESIQRLPPLVGNIADHLSHGGLTTLLNEHTLLFA